MVNDPIPSGVDEEPLFSDEDLLLMFLEHVSIFGMAAEIWTIKAGLIQGDIQSYSAGNEKYDLTSMKDRYTHALAMAKMYKEKADELIEDEETSGGMMLKFRIPDVM
ncbi:hypothetical protein HMPREF9372_3358 [Sporosarcina newyorkensis 2681]|uniref:Uncharacterized protein n=1 Tax=Sporosarcina newyorkensis 2681 TaxID=1027292 RepID=F9DX27_9BACL|nr:hypothetical protein [Sporosarcina newyorkensis]EGQ21075.1 hypothetical protein HMPREF9372_3358 [Sporosarcina newyorkensis 2681]